MGEFVTHVPDWVHIHNHSTFEFKASKGTLNTNCDWRNWSG